MPSANVVDDYVAGAIGGQCAIIALQTPKRIL